MQHSCAVEETAKPTYIHTHIQIHINTRWTHAHTCAQNIKHVYASSAEWRGCIQCNAFGACKYVRTENMWIFIQRSSSESTSSKLNMHKMTQIQWKTVASWMWQSLARDRKKKKPGSLENRISFIHQETTRALKTTCIYSIFFLFLRITTYITMAWLYLYTNTNLAIGSLVFVKIYHPLLSVEHFMCFARPLEI